MIIHVNYFIRNHMLKQAAIASILLAGSLALTGCTAETTTPDANKNSSTYGTYKDFTDNVKVTDEFGEYMSTKLNSNSKATTYDPSRTQPDFYRYGFNDKDGQEIQTWIANFVATEGVDSIVLDNPNVSQKWIDTKFDEYMGGDYAQELKTDILKEDSSFVVKGLPLTVRDSKPRITSNVIHINSISAYKNDEGTFVEVYGTATTKYRATEKNIVANTVKVNAEQKLDEGTITAIYPGLNDGKEEVIDSKFDFYYIMKKIDNKWKIVGYNNNRVYQIESMRNENATSSETAPASTEAPAQ